MTTRLLSVLLLLASLAQAEDPLEDFAGCERGVHARPGFYMSQVNPCPNSWIVPGFYVSRPSDYSRFLGFMPCAVPGLKVGECRVETDGYVCKFIVTDDTDHLQERKIMPDHPETTTFTVIK